MLYKQVLISRALFDTKKYFPYQQKRAFSELKELSQSNVDIWLKDFDAHNLQPGTFTYEELWNNPKIKVGHAYVLAMLLEGVLF